MVATRAAKDKRKLGKPERRSSSRIKDLSAEASHVDVMEEEADQPETIEVEMTDAEIEATLRHTDALKPDVKAALVALRRHMQRPMPPRAFTLPFTPEEIKSIGHRKVVRHPPPYGRINKSIYLSTTLPVADLPVHKCDCFEEKAAASSTRRAIAPPEPRKKRNSVGAGKATSSAFPQEPEKFYCGENCHNRMLLISCSPDTCSAPDAALCTNRAFQRRETKPVRVEFVDGPGFGLFAEDAIEPGEFIIEYVGEMIDDEECERRLIKYRDQGEEHFYMLEIEKDVVIDARYRSNEARFINHSCDSNSMTQKWNVDGLRRIGIFARRRILPQEEITIDYNFSHFGDPMDCKCGSAACTGKLGLKRSDVRSQNALMAMNKKHTTQNVDDQVVDAAPPLEIQRPVLVSSLALLKSATTTSDTSSEWVHQHHQKIKSRLFVGHTHTQRSDRKGSVDEEVETCTTGAGGTGTGSSHSSPLSCAWSSATTEEDSASVASSSSSAAVATTKKKPLPLVKSHWYEKVQRGAHLREMRQQKSYVCGGKHDWTDDLLDLRPAPSSSSSSTSSSSISSAMIVAKRVSLADGRAQFFTDLRAFANGSSKWNARVPVSSGMTDPGRIYRFIDTMKSGQSFHNHNQNDLNEDACHRCGLAGELLCCDGCPAAFHINCTNLATVPAEGEPWFCSDCKRSARQRAHVPVDNASTAGATAASTGDGDNSTRRNLRGHHHLHQHTKGPSLKRIFHTTSAKDNAAKRRPRKRMKTTDKSYRLLEQMPLPTWDEDDE